MMNWLYTAVVRPITSYGAVLWTKKLEENKVIKDLCKFQRKACLMITNASCSTPTAGMEAVLSMRPLHIHLKEIAISCFYRMSVKTTGRHRREMPAQDMGVSEFTPNHQGMDGFRRQAHGEHVCAQPLVIFGVGSSG